MNDQSDFLNSTSNEAVSPETQDRLNKPLVKQVGFDDETLEFITDTMRRVYSGELNLYLPASLRNNEIYEQLDEIVQGKADILAVSLCDKLRQLQTLMEASGGEQLFIAPTYQAENLVLDIKYRKEQFEQQYGDVFII